MLGGPLRGRLSVAFGPQMIRWADARFAARFGARRPAPKKRYGKEHAAYEWRQWLRHLLAYVVAGVVLALFTVLVGEVGPALPLWSVMEPWSLVLVISLVTRWPLAKARLLRSMTMRPIRGAEMAVNEGDSRCSRPAI
jgi:hypothetical protein